MKPMIETRLEELRREYEAGAGVMNELQKKQDELRTTLMRISGAIQALEELLATEAAGQDAAEAQPVRRSGGITVQEIQREAAEEEREACAKLCEEAEIPFDIDVWLRSTKKEMTAATALALAAAIRARGQA